MKKYSCFSLTDPNRIANMKENGINQLCTFDHGFDSVEALSWLIELFMLNTFPIGLFFLITKRKKGGDDEPGQQNKLDEQTPTPTIQQQQPPAQPPQPLPGLPIQQPIAQQQPRSPTPDQAPTQQQNLIDKSI